MVRKYGFKESRPRFQANIAARMVLVHGSLFIEVGKYSSRTFLSRWVMALPSSSGVTIGAMDFFWGIVFLHSMPLRRIGMHESPIIRSMALLQLFGPPILSVMHSQMMIVWLRLLECFTGCVPWTPPLTWLDGTSMPRKFHREILLPPLLLPHEQFIAFSFCLWFPLKYYLEVFFPFESVLFGMGGFSRQDLDFFMVLHVQIWVGNHWTSTFSWPIC